METETHNVTFKVTVTQEQREFIQNLAKLTGLTERQTMAALVLAKSDTQSAKTDKQPA